MARQIIRFVCVYVMLLVSILLYMEKTYAGDVLDLKELSIEYKNYSVLSDYQRVALIYPDAPKDGLDVNINSTLLRYFGWDSKVHSVTDDGQYRGIGLQMAGYLNLTQEFSFGWQHHSQHVLDREHAFMRFPAEDLLFVKIYLYAPRFREALF